MRLKKTSIGQRRIIVHTPEPDAGAGQYVAEFVAGLAAEGESVELFCPKNFSYTSEVAASGTNILFAPTRAIEHANLARRLYRNVAFALGALRAFWRNVRRGDLVHFQFSLRLGLGLLFFFVARVKGALVVLTVHDPVPHRWVLPRPLRWLEALFLSIGYCQCDKLVVHNQTGKQILVKQFNVDSRDVAVIPHGPLNAPSPIQPQGEIDNGHPLRLLVFGSVRENKGIHLAIRAVQQLRLNNTGRSVCLTIAGRIPNLMERPYWETCKALIREQPSGIEVIERVIPDDEVGPLLAQHDAVLLTYTNFFSDSGVAMLALSHCRPIVATRAGGLGELMHASDCGVAIETSDVSGVVDAIQQARLAPIHWLRRKGMNGYSFALQNRSWRSIARQTQKVYDDILLKNSKKVVIHSPEPASSASLYLEAISKALAADTVPITVVCPANLQALSSLEHDRSIDVHTCCERATKTSVSLFRKVWDNSRFIGSSAWTLLRSTKPGDIVHLQYILHLPFGLIFLLCAWLRRAHIVFTVHDPVPHKFLFPLPLRGVEMVALLWAYQWSDVLIVHSEAGKRTLIRQFSLPAEKIRVIVHGPYELKEKVQPCPETNRLEVLFFGSLRENKAPHLAIQAVQQLAAEGVSIRLTIAGQVVNRKEEEYWARCRTSIDPNSQAVRLLEHFVPDDELPELFSNCHCFVLPYTTFSSDSGVAYMAMANAKPIVSTSAGGLGWLLEQSRGGIAISEATHECVVAALRLAADIGPQQLEHLGQVGADWVLSHCGWPKVARATREVYAQWLDELQPGATDARVASISETPVEVTQ